MEIIENFGYINTFSLFALVFALACKIDDYFKEKKKYA